MTVACNGCGSKFVAPMKSAYDTGGGRFLCPGCGAAVTGVDLGVRVQFEKPTLIFRGEGVLPDELRLTSQRRQRAQRLDDPQYKCVRCVSSRATWRYRETNWGCVALCNMCKGEVSTDAFGSRDAMSGALSGGHWDSDRSKH